MGDTSSLDFMRSRKVFEINPEHEIIKGLNVSSQPALGVAISIPSIKAIGTGLRWQTAVKFGSVTLYPDDLDFVYSL
jgi:hypothetical protein